MLDPDTTLLLYWTGQSKGLGEPMVLGWMTQTLVDNGIPALFQQRPRLKRFSPLACPVLDPRWMPKKIKKHRWYYEKTDSAPIHVQYLYHYSNLVEQPLKVYQNYVPVKFFDMPEVRSVDVVVNTKTGGYTPYKRWSHFKDLFKLFRRYGISYINLDLDWRETYGIKCLNYVKKAKVYLGLDTGMSHYVSIFANGKAIILNGGYVPFNRWAWLYDYEVIQIDDMPCRPCQINKYDIRKGIKCRYKNRCMTEIDPQTVFERICAYL